MHPTEIMTYKDLKTDDHGDVSDSEKTNLKIRIQKSSISHNKVYQKNLSKLCQNVIHYEIFLNLCN